MNTKEAKETKDKTEREVAMDGDQEKLNVAMKKHLESMKLLGLMLNVGVGMGLMILGYMYCLRTDWHFGDVPMVLGAYWMFKTITE